MCHGFDAHDWSETVDEEAEEEPENEPSFLNNEADEDLTVLTDGGDEDE